MRKKNRSAKFIHVTQNTLRSKEKNAELEKGIVFFFKEFVTPKELQDTFCYSLWLIIGFNEAEHMSFCPQQRYNGLLPLKPVVLTTASQDMELTFL